MKVSTRIITGFAILLLLSLVTAIYQITMIHKMQTINEDLSRVGFQTANVVDQMKQDTFDLEDYSQKYFALHGDPLYERELMETRSEFATDVTKLQATAHTPAEDAAIKTLSNSWEQFWVKFAAEKANLPAKAPPDALPGELPESLQNALDKIHDSTR